MPLKVNKQLKKSKQCGFCVSCFLFTFVSCLFTFFVNFSQLFVYLFCLQLPAVYLSLFTFGELKVNNFIECKQTADKGN